MHGLQRLLIACLRDVYKLYFNFRINLLIQYLHSLNVVGMQPYQHGKTHYKCSQSETAILNFILDQTIYKINIIYKTRINIVLEVVCHPCKT